MQKRPFKEFADEVQEKQVKYWKDILENALDADDSRRDYDSGRACMTVGKAMRIAGL